MNLKDNYKIINDKIVYKCNSCTNTIEISSFSSAGISEIVNKGWTYQVIEIPHIIPEQIIKSKYIGDKVIKEYTKIEKKLIIECDLCKRNKKIKNIKLKMGI